MSLIQCPECNKDVSDQAATCPNCGWKVIKPASVWMRRIKIGLALVIIITFWRACSSMPSTPSALQISNPVLNTALAAERNLKALMKDPGSLKISNAIVMDKTLATCIEYRAKNSFGAYDNDQAVYAAGVLATQRHELFSKMWDDLCAGKKGTNVTAYLN